MSKPVPTRSARYWPEVLSFIKTELDLGLAFSTIALSATKRETTVRNTAHALTAFDVARRYVSKARLTPEDSKEIDSRFEKLRANLVQLSAFLAGSVASRARLDPMER